MKRLPILLLCSLLFSCTKDDKAPTTTEPAQIRVTASVVSLQSRVVFGTAPYWFIRIQTDYAVKQAGTIYFKFVNPYFSGSPTVRVNTAIPVTTQDTTIEITSQPASAIGLTANGFVIDSVVSNGKRFTW